uniref:CCZ1/INTU/HSP4 first Longin domain-containing protein n=1 Tax=Clastoptera arizonana TaxID=38151 RepID=A0A1B6CC35_9HEMI
MCIKNENMTENTELTLNNFYIFNKNYGQTEGEEEQKVMYYYPVKTNIDVQIKNIGLSEAIIQFTETFNPICPCESLHTQKTRHIYFQPEENFWMVMTVNVPTTSSAEGKAYHGDDVQNVVCLAVLKQAYYMARLFLGPFYKLINIDNGDPSILKQKLDHFYNRYLPRLRLQHCDILDVFQGVQFLPLDKQTFLHIQCFANLIESTFADIDYIAFLYNERLIWSGLEPDDMQVVFKYLVTNLLPAFHELEQQSSTKSSKNSARFVTGPANLHNPDDNIGKIPRLYLRKIEPEPCFYQLVVYKMLGATICFFINEKVTLTVEMFRLWDAFMSPRLVKVVPLVTEYANKHNSMSSPSEGASRFVYFNRMNLAMKTTIHQDQRKTGNIAVTPQVLKILADINAQHQRMLELGCPTSETVLKTTSDYWVVGKMSNAREFYVAIQHKNANLIEINGKF